MLGQRIIDGHSHIGIDWTWELQGKLAEYLKYAKALDITDSFLMPTPMPVLRLGKCEVVPVTLGDYGTKKIILQGIQDSKGLRGTLINQNPYTYANMILYQQIASCNTDIRLHFVPLVHPIFDTINYLELLILCFKPIALKVHGYSCIMSPQNISYDFWKLVQYYKIPLIIHTDCDTSSEKTLDSFYRNENSPFAWIQLLLQYNIRAYLTHGIRLCPDSCRIVNESNNFIVGLGPDKLLSTTKDRLYSNDSYLDTLFSMVDSDKICFDLDYPWNTQSYDNLEYDWNSLNRLKALGLTDSQLQNVLYKNISNFYGL